MIPIFHNYALRYWRADDCPGIVRYANNSKIAMNLRDGFPYPYGMADAARFVEMAMGKDPQTFFAIVADDEVIGSIGVVVGTDVHRLTGEMGYWLAEPFWGRGIMTRTVVAFSQWAFEQLKLVRIWATPFAANLASAKVLEKAGFQLEGTLRSNVLKNGQILDQYVYAKLSDTNARLLREDVE